MVKVVGIIESVKNKKDLTYFGIMKRIRIGPKENNKWK